MMTLALLLACTTTTSETCDACDVCIEENVTYPTRAHVDGGLDYDDPPPAGGDHDPCWAPWGVSDTELADENWVHNLEHGGVVLLYNCPDGCAEQVQTLTDFVAAHPDDTILTPYSLMDTPFAVVAWEHRLLMDCVDEAAIAAFYQDHRDQAPESTTSMPPEDCMQ